MSGAYVAKPGVTTDPDVPPGWDFDWMFPGPFPPGYESELALDLTAPAMMIPGIAVGNIVLTLTDHITFETREPSLAHTYKASWRNPGGAIELKLAGEEDWGISIEANYSLIDDFWGSEPSFEFNVTADDIGKTIVLKAMSVPFGKDPLEAEAEILVVAPEEGVPYAIFKVTMTGSETTPSPGSISWGASLHFGNITGTRHVPYAQVMQQYSWNWIIGYPHWPFGSWVSPAEDEFEVKAPTADGNYISGVESGHADEGIPLPKSWLIGECNSNQMEIKLLLFRPYQALPWVPLVYEVKYDFWRNDSDGASVTFDFTFEMYDAEGELENTWTKQVVLAHGEGSAILIEWVSWLTIDGTTREVTVVNP